MKKLTIGLSLLLTFICVSCERTFRPVSGGVIIRVENGSEGSPRMVRLLVINDSIIHVSATAECCRFSTAQSLVVVAEHATSGYKLDIQGDTAIVATSALKAYALASTGEVWITDHNGKMLLKELDGGSKDFKPYQCVQTDARGKDHTYRGWTIQQVFDNIFPEEGLYGLGQHQGDEWNWKGRNEELFQYNTKVSLPFVVSNQGYGILFDSYSLCRFGNERPYSQLGSIFDLTDMNGQSGALTGTYQAPNQPTIIRREDSIYFEDIFQTKNLPAGFPLQQASVVYEGTLTPHATGTYRFCHYYSGYQQLFINGTPLSEQIWRTAWNPNARKYEVEMEQGKQYAIRLEWLPDGGEAYCGLRAYAPVEEERQQQLSFWSEMNKQLDYYFIYGGSDNQALDHVIGGYRLLTGKAPLMPDWAHGYWQSRERYKTQEEILTALDGFRQRQLPIDNIVMDWNYWEDDQWGAFQFDPARFSNPKEMIDSIHRQNAKIMISCWPKYYLATDNFWELQQKGYIYQQSLRDSLYDWLGYHYAFYDAYQPEARKIFWRQLWENLGVLGMDAWWMDASEPNIRDCTPIEYRKLLCGPTYLGSSDEFFNAYSIVNAEAIYDGQRQTQAALPDGEKRVFLLTRNGFCGQQRYSTATWSGDIGTRWEDMKAQITAGLNFSIAGIPYWSQDIGGFSVEQRYVAAQQLFDATGQENADLKEWREMNARWHQWGMFAPIYRSHGQFPFREPWNIAPEDHPVYQSIQQCLELRYRLMPYIYSMAAAVHFEDYTIMRPLVMDYADDPRVRDIAYQFMFGHALMICPVCEYGARTKEVYFPANAQWFDFYSGQLVSKGAESKVVSAPLEHSPIFVRSGSIIPFGPACEYTGQHPDEPLRIYVYQGADGEMALYEDEGNNYHYEQGKYSYIRFSYSDSNRTLSIAEREGEFDGMVRKRTFVIVPVSATHPVPYDPDADGIEVTYDGASQIVQL